MEVQVGLVYLHMQVMWLCRYTQSNAYKTYKQSGKMQFSEFGTMVSLRKNLWNIMKGQTGLGEGGGMQT